MKMQLKMKKNYLKLDENQNMKQIILKRMS
jgi:hypothetical protein